MLNFVLALIAPLIMMLFFTKVSYSRVGALIVTLMIVIFAFNGLQQSVPTILAGTVSLIAGFIASSRIQKKNRGV